MKNLIFVSIIISTLNDKSRRYREKSMSDRTITLARKYGVKALPIKDLFQFFKASKACSENGGETLIDQIILNEYNKDFKASKFMSGWTSTYGMCVTAIIFYFFVSLIIVDK